MNSTIQLTLEHIVDAYVRTLGQSRDNQKKRGWPYSMSMGLCPTRASRAREPRYKVLEINANLMENDFRKKINAEEEVEFHNKGN